MFQALHRRVRLRGAFAVVLGRGALHFGIRRRAVSVGVARDFPSLRLVLPRPPGVQPRREARVFRGIAQPPDHRCFLVLRERLALPGEHALQHLSARPADDQPHQPPLLRFREVLLEQRPQLRLLARDVRLQAHAHRRARRLQTPFDVVHGGLRGIRFRERRRRNQQSRLRGVLGVADASGDAQVAEARVEVHEQLRLVLVVQRVRVRDVVQIFLVLQRGEHELVLAAAVRAVDPPEEHEAAL